MNIEKTMKSLQDRGFAVSRFATGAEAAEYLCGEIHNTTVGFGGSMTLDQLGLYEKLGADNEVIWHWKTPGAQAQGTAARVYITSANAVSEDGEIVNIDGTGNRVAATLYNKDAVYFVIGTNKIEENFEKALWRARNVAAPKNAKRLNRNTPCAVNADRCYDCKSPERICKGLAVLWGPMTGMGKVEIVIIDEELGA